MMKVCFSTVVLVFSLFHNSTFALINNSFSVRAKISKLCWNNIDGVRRSVGIPLIMCTASGGDDMLREEWEVERQVQKIEKGIRVAVSEERYEDASKLRDLLSSLQIDDSGAVLARNTEFYSAFSKKNKEKMASLWLRSDHVLCIHPGQEPIIGYDDVVGSWSRMFSSGDAFFLNSVVNAKGVRIYLKGTFAWVTCTEEVSVTADQPASRTLSATNMFIKSRGRWWMVHHHASQSSALPQNGKSNPNDTLLQTIGQVTPTVRLIKPSDLGSILSEGASEETKIGHMKDVLEALSDILNDGGSDDDESSDIDVQLIGGLQASHFKLPITDSQSLSSHGIIESDHEGGSDDGSIEADSSVQVNLAKKTVDAIRRLKKEGRLTESEKIQLITDVIKHAASDEASMAEIAYELLIAHDNEDMSDEGRVEDFVDQCKALTELISSQKRKRGSN